ncbi:hypothetical protein [Staphylococcus delphini]|uniref:hypothetical protein n=1 Tax=Staphylococcus delphini TaxID=53344 RepID=UPI0012D319DE|nr:hypothetical protein [Staphylococcus delphini]MTV22848.1 hypothetical protein [Staphylococcus delphini]
MMKQEVRKSRPDSLRTLFKIHKSVLKDYKKSRFIKFIIIVISLSLSFIINVKSDNVYDVISDFSKLILPYYSISIGFTITSATFLVNSINKDKHLNINGKIKDKNSKEVYKQNLLKIKSVYIKAVSTIIFYVFYALMVLILLFTQILLGKYISIPGSIVFYVNILGVAVIFFLILYSFLLFILIVHTVYLFCITYIDHTIGIQIKEIDFLEDEKSIKNKTKQ